MNTLLTVAIPTLAATASLGAVAGYLHLSLQRRLDGLERRLGETADVRVAGLATTIGEELGAQRASNEILAGAFARLERELERLGADVVNRELYRGGTPRQGDAIAAVRDGGDVTTLMRQHGLPLEEAELLVSLYAGAGASAEVL